VTTQPSVIRCDFTDLIVSQCEHCVSRTADSTAAAAQPQDTPGDQSAAAAQPQDTPQPRGRRNPGAVHVCLSCGGSITAGQDEERVPTARGPYKGSARYRHTRSEDCQAALRQPPGGNVALIGRYRELAPLRVVSARHTRT
jgi:hypothetical protein